MPKSKPRSRSLFTALPVDLKKSIRSQVYLRPPEPSSISVGVKKELLNSTLDNPESNELLATQPDSPSSSSQEISNELDPTPEPLPEPLAAPIAGPSKPPAWAGGRSTQIATPSIKSNGKRLVSSVEKYDGADWTPVSGSRKKQKRRQSRKGNPFADHRWDCTGLVPRYTGVEQVPADLVKYWYQRLTLLPLYDELPLLLDHTGWFSITPHPIAEQIAMRCQCDVIVDAFCGVGGNAIEFAKTCERVIAIDNDPIRLRLARHNALQLGVADRIEFVLADFVPWAKQLALREGGRESIDVIFLSPPWGGIDYLSAQPADSPAKAAAGKYSLASILPIHGAELFAVCKRLTPNIAYYLPRNMDLAELGALAEPLTAPGLGEYGQRRDREWVEVEEEWFGEKLKAVTAYFGGLIAE